MKYKKIGVGLLLVILCIIAYNMITAEMTSDAYLDGIYLGQINNYVSEKLKTASDGYNIDLAKVPYFERHAERFSISSSIVPQENKIIIIYNPGFRQNSTDWIALVRRADWRNSIQGPLVLLGDGTIVRSKTVLKGIESQKGIKVYSY